jgi:glucose/arabinose dehydrogenase
MRRWLSLVLLFAACTDDRSGEDGDGERDGGRDGGLDASDARGPDIDAGDARVLDDASSDARTSEPDATIDASFDAGPDAELDARVPCDASVAPALPALRLQAVAEVGALVFAAQAPGSDDWYLVQQTGFIRVLRDGALLPEPFLDVSAELPSIDERGLLGLAFPPDYAQSGKFYIALTASAGENRNRDSVYEYQRAQDGTSSRTRTIVQLPASAENHNGGTVLFGPDGFLYYGTGDGGGGCNSDRPGAAQDPSSLFGKILRLDPRAAEPYGAADNPFAADAGDPRVLHSGLRNPFRYGFDRLGGLFIGDVGQGTAEELDFGAADARGLNFGWPAFEGDRAATCSTGGIYAPPDAAVAPIVHIPRNVVNPFSDYASVIGGPTYRGSAIERLHGTTLFGDYYGARMGALVQCGAQTSPVAVIAKNGDPNQPSQPSFARPDGSVPFGNLSAIVEDNAGELYFVANNSTLYKVVAGE